MAQMVKNLPAMRDLGSNPGFGRAPGGWHGNPLWHGQRSLTGYNPWGHKVLAMTERLSAHSHKFQNSAQQGKVQTVPKI